MKFTKNNLFLLAIVSILLINAIVSTKNLKKKKTQGKQVQLTRDTNGFNAAISQVVRKSPSVTTTTKLGTFRLKPPTPNVYMSNSNTSNAPNVGYLGEPVAIVEPHIVMHSKSPISVVKETPAHLGWRNEQQTISTLNLENGKAEHHTRTNKIPLYGNVEEVKTIYKTDVRSYDIAQKRHGPIVTGISSS